MAIAAINQTEIYYEVHGEGIPLLLIPGVGATHEMYEPQIQFFKKTHQVICLDLRGNGKSGTIKGPVRDVFSTQTKDVLDLLDYLKIDKVILLGTSYGGVFVQHFAIRYPHRVSAIVISDSFCDTRLTSLKKSIIVMMNYNIQSVFLPKKWIAWITKQIWKPFGELASNKLAQIVMNMRRMEYVIQRLAVNRTNTTRDLPFIAVPTLGIVGNHTKIGVDLMKELVSYIPDAELEIIENSFDPSGLCQPEKFNQAVISFLKKHNCVTY